MLDEQAANQRKRKREEEGEVSDAEGVETEAPPSNDTKKGNQTKKQKREVKVATSEATASKEKQKSTDPSSDALRKAKAGKKKEKRERKKAREEAKAAKTKAKKERKAQETALEANSKTAAGISDASDAEGIEDTMEVDLDPMGMAATTDDPSQNPPSSTATPSTTRSPAFDASESQSGSSSISSIAPHHTTHNDPTAENVPQTQDDPATTVAVPSPSELKARLDARLLALRQSRNADPPSGAPARNRQELIELRRKKEEQRRAHKKDLRAAAKEEELRQRNETLARGSPLLANSPLLQSPSSPINQEPSSPPTNLSFSRITFPTGHRLTPSLNPLPPPSKPPKGPSDPATALLAAQHKAARLSTLPSPTRSTIASKDSWLNARKHAQGERVRDDTSLLKKTLKRKEKAKKKSEREWGERSEGVRKGVEGRQRRREENLKRRREEKGGKGKKKGKGGGKPKVTARPGFEGSFKAKAPRAAGGGGGVQGPRRR